VNGEIAVELAAPGGGRVRIEWDAIALAELRPGLTPGRGLWRLSGELDWNQVDALRVFSGRLGDGRSLAIAGLRPAGAAGHGDDACAGLIGSGSDLGHLSEVLFSTEYGADGRARRIGLELVVGASDLPLRVAGDALEASTDSRDGVLHERIGLVLRSGGAGGHGVLELRSRT
jgi:hypothetical protein